MKKVTLWGYYGFGNVGDEALLASVLSLIKNQEVVISCGPMPSIQPSKKIQLIDRKPLDVWKSISSSDGFILGPGGLIHERRKLQGTYYHLFGPFAARLLKKPFCAIGQQIGPFGRKLTEKLARSALLKADFICVRDKTSFETAKAIGLKPTLSSDLAFLLEPDEPSKRIKDLISELQTPRTVFAPAVDLESSSNPETATAIIKRIISKTKGSVIMVPFFPGRDDEYISKCMEGLKEENVLALHSPISWQDAFGTFRMSQYSIPMRLHAVIASSLTCLPALPIPYSSKVSMIAKELGYDLMLTSDDSYDDKIELFLEKSQNICKDVTDRVREMKKRAEISVKLLDEFLGQD